MVSGPKKEAIASERCGEGFTEEANLDLERQIGGSMGREMEGTCQDSGIVCPKAGVARLSVSRDWRAFARG